MSMTASDFKQLLEQEVLDKIRTEEFLQTLVVIDSGMGYAVELTHDGALKMLQALQDAVYSINGTLRAKPDNVIVAGDRVIVTYMIEILLPSGHPVFTIARMGECTLNRQTRSGSMVDDNAARTAETRALKRAVGAIIPKVHELFKVWSEWVNNQAPKFKQFSKQDTMQYLRQALIDNLRKKIQQSK